MIDPKEGVRLADHTTFHIGGTADHFITAHSLDELKEACSFARERSLPILPIGGGSNILVRDDGVRGVVIKIALPGIVYEPDEAYGVRATVGAGESWDAFVADAVLNGYWGVENLSAIPGTVGATPIQNVGAYGVEVASLIEYVEAFDTHSGEVRRFTNDECAFGYRSSFFKTDEGQRYIVTAVCFKLTRVPTPHIHYKDLVRAFGDHVPELQEVRDAVIRIRARKFPDLATYGTAGSFFKNPRVSSAQFTELKDRYPDIPGFPEVDGRIKVPLGWILDKLLGLRGYREGAVGTYEGQSLVLVNFGGATALNVDAFARTIETKVFDATGVEIEREVMLKP